MDREEAVIEETEEENTQLNAKDTKIFFAQQCCCRIIFLTSTTGFVGLAFFLASSNISGTTINLLIVFLSGLIGSILLRRVFSTNTRIDRTSSIDYMLSSQEIKEKIIEIWNCPIGANIISDINTEYIVIFKTKVFDEAQSHFNIIGQCIEKSVVSSHSNVGIKDDDICNSTDTVLSGNPNRISINKQFRNLSIPHGFYAFSGYYNQDFISALSNWDAVDIVTKAVKTKVTNSPNSNLQRRATQNNPVWNLDRIDQEFRPLNGEFIYPDCAGSNIAIYIVDSGIDIRNPDFEGRAVYGKSVCDGCIPCPFDDYGVAKNSTLIAVKAFDDEGEGYDTDVIAGLQFVSEDRITRNLASIPINLAIEALIDSGIHVVGSAGNQNQDGCNYSPASVPSAIAVGAVQNTDNDTLSTYSNYGPCVLIYAPGDGITSTYYGNTTDTDTGTSFSSPHVAGAIALYLCSNGTNMTPSDVRELLNSTCSRNIIGNLDPSGGNNNCLLRTPPTTG
ncbi:6807_t:CDS:2 [Gigaspora margarita]|uniref:6807_t:CDS:1 n=1 Tax=Gigaspora margarita TaxID=4874 RepID=A0ABN7V7Y1_GIGMA|nr:6807_t:CDS:2 [Gigaspora margarita]